MGRLATWPLRIFTTIASIKITGYTRSSGRFCHATIVLDHGIGDAADRVPGDVGPVDLSEMGLNVTGGHALRIQGDDVAGQAGETALALADRDRVEGAVAVPRHPQSDLADLGRHRLGVRALAAIAPPAPLDRVWLVADMVGHLDLEPGLEDLAHQSRQQPVVAGQFDTLGTSPVNELGRPLPHRRLVTHERNATRTRHR